MKIAKHQKIKILKFETFCLGISFLRAFLGDIFQNTNQLKNKYFFASWALWKRLQQRIFFAYKIYRFLAFEGILWRFSGDFFWERF
jgi:hypothetical protein